MTDKCEDCGQDVVDGVCTICGATKGPDCAYCDGKLMIRPSFKGRDLVSECPQCGAAYHTTLKRWNPPKEDEPPRIIKKAQVEIITWDEIKEGDLILWSNIPMKVVWPPTHKEEQILCLQWGGMSMPIGPYRKYYRIVEDYGQLDDRWLCPRCLDTEVEEPGQVCETCENICDCGGYKKDLGKDKCKYCLEAGEIELAW
jgi:hypothetical protein